MTHQEMADYLAEKLLGRELDDTKVSASQPVWVSANGGEMFSYDWHPQDDIGQCFEYIVSAMKKKYGFNHNNGFILTIKESEGDKWYCEFPLPAWEDATADTPEAAIVEAAYQAVKASEK